MKTPRTALQTLKRLILFPKTALERYTSAVLINALVIIVTFSLLILGAILCSSLTEGPKSLLHLGGNGFTIMMVAGSVIGAGIVYRITR